MTLGTRLRHVNLFIVKQLHIRRTTNLQTNQTNIETAPWRRLLENHVSGSGDERRVEKEETVFLQLMRLLLSRVAIRGCCAGSRTTYRFVPMQLESADACGRTRAAQCRNHHLARARKFLHAQNDVNAHISNRDSL